MPSYTTLATSGRSKLLRTDKDHTATAITTVTDPAVANRLANALTDLAFDLPARLALDVEVTAGLQLDIYERPEWLAEPAPVEPTQLTRRLLSCYDTPAASGPCSFAGRRVADVVADEPESVRRAVRDEVAYLLAGYDDVLVIARAYDHKWGDADSFFLANTALATLSDAELVAMTETGYAEFLLDRLPIPLDDTYLGPVADQGYLSVELHPAQMNAWLAHNRPHLAGTCTAFIY